jgi:HAMP domain-containing protein
MEHRNDRHRIAHGMTENDDLSLALLRREMEELRAEVGELTSSTKALVEAWNTATGLVRFVKFLSTLIAALGAIYLFVRYGIHRRQERLMKKPPFRRRRRAAQRSKWIASSRLLSAS